MKLNLGSHEEDMRDAGYVNVDIERHPGVDVVADVGRLPFGDASADEIYASHILEHFGHREVPTVLREWRRVLKRGGIMYLAVPDFAVAVRKYLKYGMIQWLTDFVWGGQEYPTAFHKAGYDARNMQSLLTATGFGNASIVDVFPHKRQDCSGLRIRDTGELVSLNAVVEG